jgi:hypothetical protein
MRKINQSFLALGLTLLSSASLLAATSTWSGASDSLFSNSANWSAAPGVGDGLVFPAATSYTVDFTAVTPNNGPILFNASGDYLFTPAGQTLTLSGDITQSGAGAVTSDISLDLGGATRSFDGAGTGLVRFNGAISGTGAGLNITGGSYALAAANTFDGGINVTGGTLKLVQAGFGDLKYQPTFDGAGSGAVTINGGRLELIAEDTLGTIVDKRISTFGASGGTMVWSNYNNQLQTGTLGTTTGYTVNGPATFVTYQARVTQLDPTPSSANDNLAGAFELANLSGTGPMTVVLRNGACMRFIQQPVNNWLTPTFTGPITIDGQPGGDVTADQSTTAPNNGTNIVYVSLNNISDPYHVPKGIFFTNACQLYPTHSNERKLASDVTVMENSSFAVQGRPNSSARRFIFGLPGGTNQITIRDGGLAQMDLQISRWVNPTASILIDSSVNINNGGTLRFARTYDPGSANVANIAVNNTIKGQGTAAKESVLDLLLDNGSGGNNGVTFNAGVSLVVNGTGTGGLRVQAKSAAAMANLLTGRTDTITGSGGTLTLAVTNNDTLTDIRGPGSPSAVALGLDKQGGNSPIYVFKDNSASLANWAGLVLKGGTVVENDSSANSMQALTLAASATIQMGTAGGSGAILNFADSSAKTWSGTLSVANWNGTLIAGGGPDQVKFGSSTAGLTPAQLAQVKWIAPNGGADVTGATILASGEIVPYVPPPTEIKSPAMVNGEFVFTVAPGVPGQTSIIQWATNLTPTVNWYNIKTNTGAFNFTNTLPYPEVFYRVLVP